MISWAYFVFGQRSLVKRWVKFFFKGTPSGNSSVIKDILSFSSSFSLDLCRETRAKSALRLLISESVSRIEDSKVGIYFPTILYLSIIFTSPFLPSVKLYKCDSFSASCVFCSNWNFLIYLTVEANRSELSRSSYSLYSLSCGSLKGSKASCSSQSATLMRELINFLVNSLRASF